MNRDTHTGGDRRRCLAELDRVADAAQRLVIAGLDPDGDLFFVAEACDAAAHAYLGWERSRRWEAKAAVLVGHVEAVAGSARSERVRACARDALAQVTWAAELRTGREAVPV